MEVPHKGWPLNGGGRVGHVWSLHVVNTRLGH